MPASLNLISVDITGDFIYCETTERPAMSRVTLASLFSRGVYDEPVTALLEHMTTTPPIPPQPQPAPPGLSSVLSAWLGYHTSASEEQQLDNIFAGQNRPVPRLRLPDSGSRDVEPADHSSAQSAVANTLRHAQDDVYGRLSSALTERGELLGAVEQRVESTAQRTEEMVAEARRVAAKQGAKRWFGF